MSDKQKGKTHIFCTRSLCIEVREKCFQYFCVHLYLTKSFRSIESGEKVQMKLKRSKKVDWQALDSRAQHFGLVLLYLLARSFVRLAFLNRWCLWDSHPWHSHCRQRVISISSPSLFLPQFILRPYRKFPSPHNCAILLIERDTKEMKWQKHHQINTKYIFFLEIKINKFQIIKSSFAVKVEFLVTFFYCWFPKNLCVVFLLKR